MGVEEHEPSGYTELHAHYDMEQAFYILGGRALFEIGEVEREVGPGDLVFLPKYLKHGYKVMGNTPFKFIFLEWRDRR